MNITSRISHSLAFRLQNASTFFKSKKIFKDFGVLLIRRGGSDIRVFKQIFIDEVYHFFPSLFCPDFIIDAGANVGYSSIWLSKMFPNSTIIAIEPEKGNFHQLCFNIKNYPKVFPVQAGLWFEKTFLNLKDTKSGSWGFITEKDINGEISTVTVLELVELYNVDKIDLLKIDIKGAEFELFSHNSEKWIPLVKIIMIETHESLKPGVNKLIDEKLLSFGFTKFLSKELSIFIKK